MATLTAQLNTVSHGQLHVLYYILPIKLCMISHWTSSTGLAASSLSVTELALEWLVELKLQSRTGSRASASSLSVTELSAFNLLCKLDIRAQTEGASP